MRFDLPTYESDYNAKMYMHRASFEARVAECVSAELLGGVLTAVIRHGVGEQVFQRAPKQHDWKRTTTVRESCWDRARMV